MKRLLAASFVAGILAACGTTATSPTPEPSTAAPPPAAVNPCLVTLLGLPEGILISETEPIPPGSQVIAAPADFEPGGTTVESNGDGTSRLTLHLRGDAIDRFATYTKAHIGDGLVLIIDGSAVAVPRIMEAMVDGEIVIGAGGPNSDLERRMAGCAPKH